MTADFIISQLLFLDAEDSTKDIKLFINSPGGSVTAGMLASSFSSLVLWISSLFPSVFCVQNRFRISGELRAENLVLSL